MVENYWLDAAVLPDATGRHGGEPARKGSSKKRRDDPPAARSGSRAALGGRPVCFPETRGQPRLEDTAALSSEPPSQLLDPQPVRRDQDDRSTGSRVVRGQPELRGHLTHAQLFRPPRRDLPP